MIYMEPDRLGWEPLLTSWCNTLPISINDFQRTTIKSMYKRFADPLLWLVHKGGLKVISVKFKIMIFF